MSISWNIRRQFFSYTKKIRLYRLFSLLLLGVLFLIVKKRRTCWIDFYRSRLFCFVLTNEQNLDNQAVAVYETWGHRCGRFVFVTRLNSSRSISNSVHGRKLPIEVIPNLPDESYAYLSDKVREALLYFNEHYPDYDWYLKADDDTYIIVENLLRFLVSTLKRRSKAVLYGYRFRDNNHVSGGAGYVLTREGLQLFSTHVTNPIIYGQCNITAEDMMIGSCFQKIFQFAPSYQTKHLTIVDETVDSDGRERFHPLAFRVHFKGPSNKTKREWIHNRPLHHNLFGYEAMSETTISFHYTQPADMYQMDSLLYRIRQFDKEVCLAEH